MTNPCSGASVGREPTNPCGRHGRLYTLRHKRRRHPSGKVTTATWQLQTQLQNGSANHALLAMVRPPAITSPAEEAGTASRFQA